MMNRNSVWNVVRWIIAAVMASVVAGCNSNAKQAPPPPPKVSVMEVTPQPVTVYDEYVGQTQAPDTIEIRSQATGLLERQTFVDGAHVKKGDLLYVIDQRPFQAQLEQALASLAQAEANLLNAQQTLERNTRLIAQKAVSQQDYDSAVAQEHAGEALVDAQKALVRNAEVNLEYTTLRAPRDGFISSSQVKPGSVITAQQTLLTTLYSNDPMWVTFTISEYKFLELQKRLKHAPNDPPGDGLPFRLRLADGTDYPLVGALDFIDAAIDQKSGTLQARVSVRNPERLLRPGLFARVIVPDFESRSAIRIPQGAVQELQGLKSVYVVGVGDRVESRRIAANYRVGDDWVVDSGLNPGDRVVVEGTAKLKPGIPVQPLIVVSAAGSNAAAAPAPSSR
jgi:membrane fusion protein, multidrug efflux system